MSASSNARLGLALSGGGFRAAFFHLGVLRRLAEYDLLRHVTTISTVSGGSIVAAHYYLHFKKAFEKQRGVMRREHYIEVVRAVEEEFIEGNQADVRNLLLMNPLAHLGALVLGRGYGKWMSRLYTKYFYRRAIESIYGKRGLKNGQPFARRGLSLHRAITRLPNRKRRNPHSIGYPDRGKAQPTLLDFNRDSHLANIPRLVINATCLNTGGPFQFMMNEVGGPKTGYVRTDEVFMLLQYKMLIESMGDDACDSEFIKAQMAKAIRAGSEREAEYPELPPTAFRKTFPEWTIDHLCFYMAARMRVRTAAKGGSEGKWMSPAWRDWRPRSAIVRTLLDQQAWITVEHLLQCDYGLHRRAKIAAWYLLDRANWAGRSTRAGFTRADYMTQFWRSLEAIDPRLLELKTGDSVDDELAALILDLYYLRTADVLDWQAPKALNHLTLSDAVAASANFPPVFTPFKIFGLFNPDQFRALSLTDGGVHDNQGIDAVLDDRSTYVIASDAGGLVAPQSEAPESRIPMMDRIIDVLMGAIRTGQMASIEESCRISDLIETTQSASIQLGGKWDYLRHHYALRRAAVFHMTSNPAESSVSGLPELEPEGVARLRTDLDLFNEVEVSALRYQGYQLADHFARWFVEGADAPFPLASVPPAESPVDLSRMPEDAPRILHAGAHLFGRFTKVYPLVSIFLAMVAAMLADRLAPDLRLPWEQLRQWWESDIPSFLPPGLPSPYSAYHEWRDGIAFFFSGMSVITIALMLWATTVALQLARRQWRRRRRGAIVHASEVRRSRWRTVRTHAFRLPNLISLFGLVTTIITCKAKWLVLFLPLWSLPLSIMFAVIHVVFSNLWKLAGKLNPPLAPPEPSREPAIP